MSTLRYLLLFGFIFTAIGVSTGVAQTPVNDSCPGAVVITGLPFIHAQNTRLATPDPNDPILACADSGGGKSVWFVYTPGSTDYVLFSTTKSTPADYDIALGLYTGTCGALVQVECVDDSIPGTARQAVLGFNVQAGVTYYLQVAEWNGGGPSGGVPTGGDLVLEVYPWTPEPLTRAPKSGSVAGGDSIVLIDAGMKEFQPTAQSFNVPENLNREQVMHPTPDDVLPALAPAGSNVVPDMTVDQIAAPPAAYPVIWKEFKGNTATGFIPPDPIMAVGPNHVIGAVNSAFGVWDKDGNLLETRDLSAWFSNVAAPVGFSDPQVLFDHYANRWIVAGGNFAPPYSFLISVSDDADPIGTWYNWSLPSGLGDSLTGNLPDYPQIGYDSLAIYITSRDFGAAFLYSRLRIIEKTQLYNNDAGPVAWTDIWDFREPDHTWIPLDGMRPSIIYGSPGEHYLVNASPYSVGTFFTVWSIQDPVGTPTITAMNVPAVEYYPAPNASQLGGGVALETGGSAIRHKAVYRDSSLWMAHSIASGPGGAYSAARYIRVNPHTGSNLEDVALASDGFWYSYPALMADAHKNIVVTYTRSGLTEYPGAFVAGHRDTDPPGLIPNVIPLAAGMQNYQAVGGGRNRWGDYMGIGLDPTDSLAIWVNTEYAIQNSNWETRLGMVKFELFPGPKLQTDRTSLAFGSIELLDSSDIQTFIIANDGDDSLVISSIDLPDSNYQLVSPPSFPHALESYRVDTFRVRFIPEAVGVFNDSMIINSNDIDRPLLKVAISGIGFIVEPAVYGTIYAGAGFADSGRLRSVDPVDGSTVPVGPSGFNYIVNLRVNPSTGVLLGLASNSGVNAATYDVVRVNSSQGDAHVITTIPLAFLKGMTFRADTLYVARVNGGIYSVDLTSGTPTLVASSGKQLSAIDINPVTGELWAAVRGGAPLDGIYKIALPSGVPTLVGTTGFGVATLDLAFDSTGVLYGMIGTEPTPNSLIRIDTATGAGTLIGPMGISSGQALAVSYPSAVYPLHAKWNLMSLGVRPPDRSVGRIIPSGILQSRVFGFDGGFVRRDSMNNMEGYWVKAAQASAIRVVGVPDSSDTIRVYPRWNLVGPASLPAAVSGITTDPPSILMTGFYSYDGLGYSIASELTPGVGYWVKAGGEGTITLNASSSMPGVALKSSAQDILAGMNSLRIEAGSDRSQTLWFGRMPASGPDRSRFEMPPIPPSVGFDARFGSGSMAEFIDPASAGGQNFPLRIRSESYPVTVRWDVAADGREDYALVYSTGDAAGETVVPIIGNGGRTFTEAQALNLRLVAGAKAVPGEFTISQNYPNPFNPSTTVAYTLPRAERVRLVVYNALGEEVATVVDAQQDAGHHTAVITGDRLASGVYFYRLTAGSFTSSRKMLLIR